MRRLKALWASIFGERERRVRLARVVGLSFVAAGFVVIALAWNGAASRNFITGQFPYLLSGGFMGLALVVTGAMLLLIATARAEREAVTEQVQEMNRLLSRNLGSLRFSANGAAAGEQVIPGATAYHRPGCRVLQGKEALSTIPVEQAAAEGLTPCRVCEPPSPSEPKESSATDPAEASSTGERRGR